MVKLENSKYIKGKKVFGELEVYNAKGEVYSKLFKLIADNSNQINFEDGTSDYKINNLNVVMRQLLIHLTNVESEEFWSNKTDEEMLEILESADNDFKDVINALIDISIEIGQDIRLENIRKLQVMKNKIVEFTKTLKLTKDIDSTLKEFGIDRELLTKIQNGDKEAIEQFQKSLIEKANKPKREYKKKK